MFSCNAFFHVYLHLILPKIFLKVHSVSIDINPRKHNIQVICKLWSAILFQIIYGTTELFWQTEELLRHIRKSYFHYFGKERQPLQLMEGKALEEGDNTKLTQPLKNS